MHFFTIHFLTDSVTTVSEFDDRHLVRSRTLMSCPLGVSTNLLDVETLISFLSRSNCMCHNPIRKAFHCGGSLLESGGTWVVCCRGN